MKTPASLYTPSARPLPPRLPEPNYPGHFQVRLVSTGTQACLKSSMFRLHHPPSPGHFHHRAIFISEALIDEYIDAYIGLEETGDAVWCVYFYDALLGRLSERDYKVRG